MPHKKKQREMSGSILNLQHDMEDVESPQIKAEEIINMWPESSDEELEQEPTRPDTLDLMKGMGQQASFSGTSGVT